MRTHIAPMLLFAALCLVLMAAMALVPATAHADDASTDNMTVVAAQEEPAPAPQVDLIFSPGQNSVSGLAQQVKEVNVGQDRRGPGPNGNRDSRDRRSAGLGNRNHRGHRNRG